MDLKLTNFKSVATINCLKKICQVNCQVWSEGKKVIGEVIASFPHLPTLISVMKHGPFAYMQSLKKNFWTCLHDTILQLKQISFMKSETHFQILPHNLGRMDSQRRQIDTDNSTPGGDQK